MKEFLVKGNQISIAGELSQTEYQAKDGTTKTSMELNANIIDLVGSKKDSNQSSERHAPMRPSEQQQRPTPANDAPYDDDIPF
jgi:single-strand DNA-binding protein